jgi:hypothetical protein
MKLSEFNISYGFELVKIPEFFAFFFGVVIFDGLFVNAQIVILPAITYEPTIDWACCPAGWQNIRL